MTLPNAARSVPAWTCVALLWGALATGASPLGAQDDVELLGRIHGTAPPAGYYAVKARNPDAFRFRRGWMARNPSLERLASPVPGGPPRFRFRSVASGDEGAGRPGGARTPGAAASLGGLGAPAVTGTFQVPLVLGNFSDTPVADYTSAEVQAEFFDGPNSRYATIEEYYAEVSGGRLDLQGTTFPWQQTGLTRAEVVGSSNGLGGDAQVGLFIVEILSALDDGTVDWGRFDNDGPDGVPNSGDDDGFVDILAVLHSTWGGECRRTGSEDRIWSHKWTLFGATRQAYVTRTPAAGGGFIRVDDYAIQPVESCSGEALNEIGVLAHELGHGFGLPDLYAVGEDHQGIGEWGLMGSGSWGCTGARPERPCHMSAWSKAVLGWVEVVELESGMDHGVMSLPPVEAVGRVYRIDAGGGSGEYFLLEDRQRTGFDRYLHAPGLLVWHVDPGEVESRWPSNTVNSEASHMGVWLRQADGRDDLATVGGGRGDEGDPFPGSTGNRAFHAGSDPPSATHGGSPAGVTLLDVEEVGSEVRFRLVTRYQTVAVRMDGGAGESTLLVDGVEVPATGHSFASAPFQRHRIVVQGGEPAGEGLRRGFEWSDDPGQPRDRVWVTGLRDTALVARFGGLEARLRLAVTGGEFGVAPGVVSPTPATTLEEDGRWFPQGTVVTLDAVPNTGYDFGEWTGAAAGQGNPAMVELDAPADVGLVFELVYGVPESRSAAVTAGRNQTVQLQAENGLAPVSWFLEDGELPQGMDLERNGRIHGAPLEDGSFVLQVRARDAQGLQATGVVVLQVAAPVLAVADLTGPLLQGTRAPEPAELQYLDFRGNRNGVYDLGDFRSFLLAHPDLPATQSERSGPVSITVPVLRFPDGGGS